MKAKTKNPYSEFYSLLAKLPFQTKESQVYEYSGQTSLSALYKKDYPRYRQMIGDMRRLAADPDFEMMNNARKQTIAAIGQWFTATGQYERLSREERLLKIKSTAVYAAGSKGGSFNKLTYGQLKRVIEGFDGKTKTKKRIDDMKELMEVKRN